jgi:hypothetical protein
MDFMALWLAQQFVVDAPRRQSLRQGASLKPKSSPKMFLRNRGISGIRGKGMVFRVFRLFRGSLSSLDWHEI